MFNTQQTWRGDQSSSTLAAAQQDRGLARVAIAGLMTLYSPPPAAEPSAMASAAGGTDAADATTQPVDDGTEPAADSEDTPTTAPTADEGAPQPTTDEGAPQPTPAAGAADAAGATAPEPQPSVPSDAPSDSPVKGAEEAPKTQQPAAGEAPNPANKQPTATETEPDAPPTGGTSN